MHVTANVVSSRARALPKQVASDAWRERMRDARKIHRLHTFSRYFRVRRVERTRPRAPYSKDRLARVIDKAVRGATRSVGRRCRSAATAVAQRGRSADAKRHAHGKTLPATWLERCLDGRVPTAAIFAKPA